MSVIITFLLLLQAANYEVFNFKVKFVNIILLYPTSVPIYICAQPKKII
jgi:hypothetical protein